jgi:hypothetical protein
LIPDGCRISLVVDAHQYDVKTIKQNAATAAPSTNGDIEKKSTPAPKKQTAAVVKSETASGAAKKTTKEPKKELKKESKKVAKPKKESATVNLTSKKVDVDELMLCLFHSLTHSFHFIH